MPDRIEAPVLSKVADNISTDEISPAGARALPFRSNIPKLAQFTFTQVDETYPERAAATTDTSTSSSAIEQGDVFVLDGLRDALVAGPDLSVHDSTREVDIPVRHRLSPRQLEDVPAGGITPKLALRERGR